MLTELLQLFELKDFLLPFLVSWAEVQGRAFQHKPAQPPVVQVMALFVVQSANQLAVPLHQSLDFRRDEALWVTRMKRKRRRTDSRMKSFHVLILFLQLRLTSKQRRTQKPQQVWPSSCWDKPHLAFCSLAYLFSTYTSLPSFCLLACLCLAIVLWFKLKYGGVEGLWYRWRDIWTDAAIRSTIYAWVAWD